MDSLLIHLPEVLEKQNLWLSQNATLNKLGYEELIANDYKNLGPEKERDLKKHFELVANQPFRNQMLYETNLLSEDKTVLNSNFLGCSFEFYFSKEPELLFASETFSAFFEGFLATSLKDVIPIKESIVLELIKDKTEKKFRFIFSEEKNS